MTVKNVNVRRKSRTHNELGRALTTLMEAGVQLKEFEGMADPASVSIYGRNSIFDPCVAGDVFGLQVETSGLMQWLGWRANKFYQRRVDFITWMGTIGTAAGTAVTSAIGPCENPPKWQYGKAGYYLTHQSWYGQGGDSLDPHTIVQDRCETSPRYRINGQIITDDVEWQLKGIMNVIQQSVRRDIIHGDHQNEFEMNGLNAMIKQGYVDDNNQPTPQLDSTMLNWDGDTLDGDANGYGNFFNMLDEVVTDIEYKSQSQGTINEDDMVLSTSRFMATALLDGYACYTTCGVTSNNDITDQALRAAQRAERRALNAGPLYDGRSAVGYIPLKSGRRLPIIVEDTYNITNEGNQVYSSDIHLLTRAIGGNEVLYGEYMDLRLWENAIRRQDRGFTGRTDQAGRFAIKGRELNFCWDIIVGTSPELYLSAPWAQARFSNVATHRLHRPITNDNFQPDFRIGGRAMYPVTSFNG